MERDAQAREVSAAEFPIRLAPPICRFISFLPLHIVSLGRSFEVMSVEAKPRGRLSLVRGGRGSAPPQEGGSLRLCTPSLARSHHPLPCHIEPSRPQRASADPQPNASQTAGASSERVTDHSCSVFSNGPVYAAPQTTSNSELCERAGVPALTTGSSLSAIMHLDPCEQAPEHSPSNPETCIPICAREQSEDNEAIQIKDEIDISYHASQPLANPDSEDATSAGGCRRESTARTATSTTSTQLWSLAADVTPREHVSVAFCPFIPTAVRESPTKESIQCATCGYFIDMSIGSANDSSGASHCWRCAAKAGLFAPTSKPKRVEQASEQRSTRRRLDVMQGESPVSAHTAMRDLASAQMFLQQRARSDGAMAHQLHEGAFSIVL